MNVLSLFDGISCGQIALNRAEIKYDKYYASEIDPHAIKVAQHNYPETIQLGDVTKIKASDLPKIDLLIGGSPCQGFSSAGKKLNFDDPRSKLFFEYSRLLKECKPKYFMLENVKMKKEYRDIISKEVGVEPIEINSALVSAQNRKRLYWTNIPGVTQPEDKGIAFKDVISGFCGRMIGRRINPSTNTRDDYNKTFPLMQHVECRLDDKSNCLSTVGKDNIVTKKRYDRIPAHKCNYRYLTSLEIEWLQTVPKNYTSSVAASHRNKLLGNGWTVDVIAHIFKALKSRH